MSNFILPNIAHPPTTAHNHELKIAGLAHIGAIPSKGVYEIESDHDDWCDYLKDGLAKGFCNCDPTITVRPARFGMADGTPNVLPLS